LTAKAGKGTKRAEEGFLTHVSRILLATDRAVRQGIDGPFPSQHELVEAVGIAANRFGDELFIRPRHAGARRVLSLVY
jgi:hypothetical protein